MGSNSEPLHLLNELRTRSQIDVDSLDVAVAKELGPFAGSTSNQADAYLELLLPHRVELLQESIALARQLSGDYADVPFEELAFEIAACHRPFFCNIELTGWE
ncbi:MAG: hypothetical protein L6R40_006365 [Gallowayella cf. fulva]|nr:MAG: hypothetical protein L6R40_006365 [Xanthomendoza cf. fulva]